jgi:hypothetical protein
VLRLRMSLGLRSRREIGMVVMFEGWVVEMKDCVPSLFCFRRRVHRVRPREVRSQPTNKTELLLKQIHSLISSTTFHGPHE